MSTTTIKNYSIAPYYDDFDETKNYHRILYRPGYAVQARELTQMQTTLQAQLDRFGQYAFKHGSRVVGGKVTLNTEYDFIKIDSTFVHSVGGTLNSDGYLSSFVDTTITGSANSGTEITAKVIAVIPSDGSDPNTLYIKYTNTGGAARTTSAFAAGEEFSSSGSTTFYGQVQSTGTPTGVGSSANIEEGVYFISGTFIYVPKASLILDKYTNTPSYVIGLNVLESIVDTDSDNTLKDNAQGTPNEAAPGATRYKVSTTLVKESLTNLNSANANYVTLLRIEAGKVQVDKTDTINQAAELSKRLARRTFEESGNYSVKPYQLDIKEHLDDTTNNGYLLAGAGGDADKLAIGVEPGTSYVQGFRNENIATKYLVIDKPRDASNSINIDANANVATPVGNYVRVTEGTIKGAPDLSNFTTMNLYNATGQGGSVVGTARARAMEKIGAEIRLHLFDITMTSGSFSAIRSFSQGHSNGINFVGNISDASALRFDIGNNGLVFKLPYNAIQTLYNGSVNTTEYTIKKDFATTVTSNQCTISIPSGQGHFTNVNTATMISVGTTVLDTTPTFVGSSNDGVSTLTFSVSASNTTKVRVVADVEVDGSDKVQKEKLRQNNAVASSIAASADGSYSLGKADIIRIVSVVDATSTNVTERFILDNGQKDNYYDIGRISRDPGSSPVSGALTITFDYYTHGAGDYFTVDSYPSADYGTIGAFNSAQGNVELRDCVDFRPRKDDSGANFTSSGASLSGSPDPSHAMSMYVKYYMPRIDKLYITKEGTLKTSIGVPSDNPKAPATPEDAMGLFDLKLKPYVFSTSDVIPTLINNKRYTMRDIGKLDKRVKNLEYYTALSLLEQSAANTQLFDASNFSRTKNGFLVDGFRGHNVGDASHPDYACSIDKAAGTLRPKFDSRNVNLVRKAADSGTVVKNASLMTLPHTSAAYITQPYSSVAVNVNPYNVFTWSGSITLSPESDEWKETDVRPDVIINDEGLYDQFVTMAEETGILGTQWNEWETNWTGTEVDVSTTTSARGGMNDWWDVGNEMNQGGRRGIGAGGGPAALSITTTTATTTTAGSSRTGLTTAIASDTVTKESGSKVVEVNFVPFIRSRKVFFKAELLKPNTKVYPFFNGTEVSAFCKAESFQEFSDRTAVITYEGATTHPAGTSALTSNANGVVEGSFVIPRNSALKFKTGTRTFKLTDSAANNPEDGSETTYAETQYHAEGLIESIQKEIMSTKVPSFVTTELNDARVLSQTAVQTSVEWIDPLAQTFLIDTEGGIFCKSLNLFFKTKDAAIPVRVSIRSVENGTPTQKIVPGADKVIYPSSVNITDDASAATTVTFDHPIFLAQNQEYAIVLMAQSDNYEAWVAEMGGFDKTNPNNRITKQPYGGVFFTSQNASTWTPEQSRDLKFNLNRCVFSGSGGALNLVHDSIPAKLLPLNPMLSTSGSAVIKVFHKNHGMQNANNPVVIISGAATFNGIAAANINGTRTIVTNTVTHDTYEITAGSSDTASATGSGGGAAIYATENQQMDVIRPVIQSLTVPGTAIRYYMTPYSETEVASTEGEVLANENVILASPKSIASDANSTTKTFNLRCVFTTASDNISPVIDMNRASLYTIQNRVIDNTVGDELSATGGNQLARYLTKKVELAEEADKIDVFLNVNRPRSGNVDLYFRVVAGGSSTDISTVAWQAATPLEGIAINDNPNVFKEIQYSIDPGGAGYTASPDTFGTMQFKIVLRSSNSATVPQVKDFRAIAST
jgi:hypothetical protein